ncbi:ABC transporter substrate-binding protein [Campylobacter insulaenigrae]|uniref:ABC transporter substrate-binding protein n=1 Tax=Campylobacter insulaenigrae TaxID=260714 RepID=A0ABY3G5H6_9BACT|nr:ABC transporter substrate-binding protein [Campylobacter insulaenigrae]TWO27502.1 ABC transporter substrate-binding protein [Campylobacter insulaenigrae]
MLKFVLMFFCVLNLFAITPKDTIVIAVENEPERINPLFSEDHDVAIGLVFSGLTRFDENMSLAPDLATSWKVSKDGLVYEFSLRDDVLWHDGVKFGAKDVEFSINALKDEKLNSPSKVNFDAVKEVKIIDDYHIRITLSNPFPAFLDALSVGVLPHHLLEKENLNTADFNQHPIGTGSYKLKQWKQGQYMILEANEKYYLTKVKTPKLILKNIKDPSISAIELKNGSIDVALVDFSLASNFQNDKNFKVLVEPSADYRALMFNLNNEFLKDIKVRIALNYAIDKNAIVESLLHSFGKVANHPLEKSWANPNKFATYKYDITKANELLKQAGFVKNKNGILEKDGKEFSFEMYAMSEDPLRVALVNILQSEFLKLGIKAKAIAKPSGSFDYTKEDSFLVGWGSPYDPDFHTFRVFASSQDSTLNSSGWNFGHYKNSKVDESLKLARNSLDSKERKRYYGDFIQALYDDPAFLFIAYIDYPLVFANNIEGVKSHVLGHHGVGFTWNAYEWIKN